MLPSIIAGHWFRAGIIAGKKAWELIVETLRNREYAMGMIIGMEETEIQKWCRDTGMPGSATRTTRIHSSFPGIRIDPAYPGPGQGRRGIPRKPIARIKAIPYRFA